MPPDSPDQIQLLGLAPQSLALLASLGFCLCIVISYHLFPPFPTHPGTCNARATFSSCSILPSPGETAAPSEGWNPTGHALCLKLILHGSSLCFPSPTWLPAPEFTKALPSSFRKGTKQLFLGGGELWENQGQLSVLNGNWGYLTIVMKLHCKHVFKCHWP